MRAITRFIRKQINKRHGDIIYIEPKLFKLLEKTKQNNNMLIELFEGAMLYYITQAVTKLPGDIAEIGCYKGGSGKIISEAKGNKNLFIFETFSGLPELTKEDEGSGFKEGQNKATFTEVKQLLKNYPNINIFKARFPDKSENIKDNKFCMVHLDADLYKATIDSLNFFYDKMVPGGIIITHDYGYDSKGVTKAFNDFFRDKPESIIKLLGCQAMIVKSAETG